MIIILYVLFTFVKFYIEQNGRALHVIQALNGNKCNAYFVSGKIKELKKKNQWKSSGWGKDE